MYGRLGGSSDVTPLINIAGSLLDLDADGSLCRTRPACFARWQE